MDQQNVPPTMQEVVREVKLLGDNIKMCENTTQLCNARLSTISALCQLLIHQSPLPAFISSQEVNTLSEAQGQVEAQVGETIQTQSISLAIFEPIELVSTETVEIGSAAVSSVEPATINVPTEVEFVGTNPSMPMSDQPLFLEKTTEAKMLPSEDESDSSNRTLSTKRRRQQDQPIPNNKRTKVSSTGLATLKGTPTSSARDTSEARPEPDWVARLSEHNRKQHLEAERPRHSANQHLDSHDRSTAGTSRRPAPDVDNGASVNLCRLNNESSTTDLQYASAPQHQPVNVDKNVSATVRDQSSTQPREKSCPESTPSQHSTRKSARKRKPTPRLLDVLAQDKSTASRSTARKSTRDLPVKKCRSLADAVKHYMHASEPDSDDERFASPRVFNDQSWSDDSTE